MNERFLSEYDDHDGEAYSHDGNISALGPESELVVGADTGADYTAQADQNEQDDRPKPAMQRLVNVP